MSQKPPKHSEEYNVYKKYRPENKEFENQRPNNGIYLAPQIIKEQMPVVLDDFKTAQQLTEQIQIIKNRLKYIEMAKTRNTKNLDSTLKRTNSYLSARTVAKELVKKVTEVKMRDESYKKELKSKVAELSQNNRKTLENKIEKNKLEKLKMCEKTRQEKMEMEKIRKEKEDQMLHFKKMRVEKLKNQKSKIEDCKPISRRNSMANLNEKLINGNKTGKFFERQLTQKSPKLVKNLRNQEKSVFLENKI